MHDSHDMGWEWVDGRWITSLCLSHLSGGLIVYVLTVLSNNRRCLGLLTLTFWQVQTSTSSLGPVTMPSHPISEGHMKCEMIRHLNIPQIENSAMMNNSRRVAFALHTSIIVSPSPIEETSITPNEMDQLWFSPRELHAIKVQNGNIVKQMRSLLRTKTKTPQVEPNSSERQRQEPELCPNPFLRGLEFKFCLERQRRCYIGQRAVIKASTYQKVTPNKLARFSSRCTAWAASLAQMEATRDFYAVYGQFLAIDAAETAVKVGKLHLRCDEEGRSTSVKRVRTVA